MALTFVSLFYCSAGHQP